MNKMFMRSILGMCCLCLSMFAHNGYASKILIVRGGYILDNSRDFKNIRSDHDKIVKRLSMMFDQEKRITQESIKKKSGIVSGDALDKKRHNDLENLRSKFGAMSKKEEENYSSNLQKFNSKIHKVIEDVIRTKNGDIMMDSSNGSMILGWNKESRNVLDVTEDVVSGCNREEMQYSKSESILNLK